jgi:hypothetical protein
MTDHSDAEPTGEEYEPPRAVRLSDFATGAGDCKTGTHAPGEDCETGDSAGECENGTGGKVSGCDSGSNPGESRGHYLGPLRFTGGR